MFAKKSGIMPIVLCVALLVSMIPSIAFAESKGQIIGKTGFVDISRVTPLTDEEAERCMSYGVKNTADFGGTNRQSPTRINKEYVISFAEEINREEVAGVQCTEYACDNYRNFIPNCKKLREISGIGDLAYVSYIAEDGNEVTVSYSEKGMNDICVYNPVEDTAYFISDGEKSKYENFREGTYYKMSEETSDLIQSYVEKGDYKGLNELPNISVIEFSDGMRYIEEIHPDVASVEGIMENDVNHLDTVVPSITTSSATSSVKGFTSTSALLKDLKSKFPTLDSTSSYTKSGSAVGKVSVKVDTSRNNYVKVTASWKNFAVGVAITLVGTYLGISTMSAVEKILAAVGVAYSAAGTLKEAVELYKAAEYDFTGTRIGRAYDKTQYNAYVYVTKYSGKGRFAGGYDSKGNWTWIKSRTCSALDDKTAESVANSTIAAYNNDVALNGVCSRYTPYGFN